MIKSLSLALVILSAQVSAQVGELYNSDKVRTTLAVKIG